MSQVPASEIVVEMEHVSKHYRQGSTDVPTLYHSIHGYLPAPTALKKHDTLTDYLITATGVETISLPRLHSKNTHGTGCTLASAIATGLAQGLPLSDAVQRARHYLHNAIRTAPGFGAGHGPVNHLKQA